MDLSLTPFSRPLPKILKSSGMPFQRDLPRMSRKKMKSIATRRNRGRTSLMIIALFSATLMIVDPSCGKEYKKVAINIEVSNPAVSFMPDEAFGAGLDGLDEKDLERIYSPENIKIMSKAAFRRLSYRLRTELGIEVWHWNEAGSWSDEEKKQGYWTSSDTAEGALMKSYGYRLPRRGSTIDQAENDSYSRLDDGDESTFWKSNPYLDAHFTGVDNALHPQWVIIGLGKRRKVNALRILWGEPYATRYEAQYWDGMDEDYLNDLAAGTWRSFEHGNVRDGKGGDALMRLGSAPVSVRFVRILLIASSGTAPEGKDVRDSLGYAIRELSMGVLDGRDRLQDIIRHGASNKHQTLITVSSTDPWHRAIDRNPDTAQPGFDRIIASGLGRGNHILTPVPILYNTPENAAAQIRFLRSRNFPVSQIELGEEPDGQNMSPEHYGALYMQFAKVVHEIDPTLITGGPGFQSEVEGWNTFPDANGERSWMKRFLSCLRERKRLDDFGFFSFEWYPFDALCEPPAGQLIEHPGLMKRVFKRLDRDGVPRNIPWILSEYGYSSFAGRAEVELPAALLNAEIVAQFLTLGGKTAYYYGLEPNTVIRELDGCARQDRLWGNLMMFQTGPNEDVKWLLPAYYGAEMLVEEWAEPTNAPHQLFHATVMEGEKVSRDVTAYVVRRPDNRWAVMILNKTADDLGLKQVRFKNMTTRVSDWNGPIEVIQYSPLQYVWQANGANGHPTRSKPPKHFLAHDGFTSEITIPPMSISVIRGPGLVHSSQTYRRLP
jgi:hypothetical protein